MSQRKNTYSNQCVWTPIRWFYFFVVPFAYHLRRLCANAYDCVRKWCDRVQDHLCGISRTVKFFIFIVPHVHDVTPEKIAIVYYILNNLNLLFFFVRSRFFTKFLKRKKQQTKVIICNNGIEFTELITVLSH